MGKYYKTLICEQTFTHFFLLEKTRVRTFSESSEGGDIRSDAKTPVAGTGYDMDGKFNYFMVDKAFLD